MAAQVSSIKHRKDNVLGLVTACFRRITEPSADTAPEQRRRIRLLAAFLILMVINTLAAAVSLLHIGGNVWIVMLSTSLFLCLGYILSRSKYYHAALALAVILPAFPPVVIAIYQPPQINLTAELMWLALPLIVAGLMLTLLQTVIITLSYIAVLIALALAGFLGIDVFVPLTAYILIISFTIMAFTAVQRTDRAEIDRRLAERYQIEKTLKESEEKFSKAFQAIPEAISISRIKDGMILDVNDTFLRTRGHKRADIVGHTASELNLWEKSGGRDRMIQMIKEQGGVFHEERKLPDKAGKARTILFSADIVEIGGEPCLITIANDITERKQMENALILSEEKFSKAFKAFPDAVAISTLKNGLFIEVNERFLTLNGYTRDEVIGHNSKELNLWANHDARYRIKQLLEKQGRFENEEFTLRRKSGELRTVLLAAEIIDYAGKPHLLTIGNDITERKRMEESLANEAIRKRILIEQSSDGIVILDQNGAVYEANRRFAEMLGYLPDEVTKLHIWDWGYEAPREKMLEMLKNVNETGDHFETEHRRKDGSVFNVEISTNGATFAGQKLIFCVERDITQRKLAQAKLKQTMTDLELSTIRLKATNKELESFSYSVSHDLRSPLRSIDGFSQALLEDYGPRLDETARDYLKRMRGASQKMGELIDGLLKLSRLSRSEVSYETVDLTALAREISARLRETSPDRKVDFVIDNGLSANGDPQMLRVLMENLLGNAWKFTGKVPQARIEFSTAVNGEKKTFLIKDNGAGFDMSYNTKLFGAFQRLHSTADFPGTGIGLATVQRIINRHGGSIRAEGTVGKGAAFYFSLP